MRYQAPKGTYDLIPPRSEAFDAVRRGLSAPARRASYGYIETPTFEDTALFARGVGESTDIVTKEMYTFDDKGGRSLTLKPEGTAGTLRAIVEHNMTRGQLPVKLWYTAPQFRYEQPQSGRYRQHWQVGVEAVGSDDPALDAEVIWMADTAYHELGITDFQLDLTSLGCRECRPAYREKLQAFLRGLDLDEETQQRAEINPLRVLDDKRPGVRAQLVDAPLMLDNLCAECQAHHDAVRGFLSDLAVSYVDAPMLVRGMDYYTRTTFEFTHRRLGAQSAMGGGGRYDGLLETLGGPSLGGIGFGLGVDRTLLAAEAEDIDLTGDGRCQVFVVPLGDEARAHAVTMLAQLRAAGVSADMAYGGRGLKGSMKAADRSGAAYAVVVGERDLTGGVAQLKDLAAGDQIAVPLADLVSTVKEKLTDDPHA